MALKSIGQFTPAGQIVQLLFVIRGASLQSVAEQQFTRCWPGTNYYPTTIVGRQRSGSASLLTAGGISDGSNSLVSSAQVWASLTASSVVTAALTNITGSTLLSATPSFTMAVPSTSPCTADIYIFGLDLS